MYIYCYVSYKDYICINQYIIIITNNYLVMNTPSNQISKAPEGKTSVSLYEPDQMVQLATHLQKIFREQNLFCKIQGREYVKVAGWQYAGTKLGLVPMVEEIADQSSEKEVRFQTRVALLNIKTNQYVGCGFGLCSNLEAGKKSKPTYAIQSLSQTRAIGKAFRNLLGWVVEMAGFESTPAEELSDLSNSEPTVKEIPATNAQRTELLVALNHECISQEERDQMFSCIYSMSAERCKQAIAKVQHKINQYDTANH